MGESPQTLDWEAVHRYGPFEALPWYFPNLDPDMAWALNLLGVRVPSVLDLGTGCGTQAIELARHGLHVVGTDVSEVAIAEAVRRAKEAGVNIRFLQDDILATRLTGPFDIIIDRGCMHVLPEDKREQYLAEVTRLLRPGGHLLLKCFSHKVPGTGLPYRLAPQQLMDLFRRSSFDLCDIRFAIYQGTMDPPPQALFCILRRK